MRYNILNMIYERACNKFCKECSLVNVDELENMKSILLNVYYLPYLIRSHLGDEYTNIILQDKSILNEIKLNNELSLKDKSFELIEWIDKHPEYNNLINIDEKNNLIDKIEKINKDINYIKKQIR